MFMSLTTPPKRIKEVLPSGTINIVKSGLSNPQGLAFDSLGDLFYADHTANQVFQISSPTVLFASSPINTGTLVSAALTGLTPAMLYYFRAVAMGPGGTTITAAFFFLHRLATRLSHHHNRNRVLDISRPR